MDVQDSDLAKYAVIAAWCAAASLPAQVAPATGPYVARGREVEARQKALTERVSRFHAAFSDTLRRVAPDLLPRLEPPPPIATGYQLLPRIVTGAPPQPITAPAPLVSYSWRWSETLMDRETAELARMEVAMASAAGRRPALDSLVTSYRGLTDRKRLVDADVHYNWLWQAEIMRIRPVFEHSAAIQSAILRMRAPQAPSQRTADSAIVAAGLAADVERVDAPTFLRFEQRGSEWTITVPIVTDIEDTAFVNEFARTVANAWRAKGAFAEYRVIAEIRPISPQTLYCGASPAAGCAPPARGAAINVAAHLARFPPGVAVLTSGAGSTHFTGGRAMLVSAHDLPRHTIVHEFGHALGFRDAYIRGYRDAGPDGFVVTELVVDNTDVMGNARDGAVKASHFERLMAAREVLSLMNAGLDALYQRGDARTAETRFRQVLARNPSHYGAGFQLAKALDAIGQAAEAAKQWRVVLKAAESIGDSATIRQVSERLAKRP